MKDKSISLLNSLKQYNIYFFSSNVLPLCARSCGTKSDKIQSWEQNQTVEGNQSVMITVQGHQGHLKRLPRHKPEGDAHFNWSMSVDNLFRTKINGNSY